MLAVRKNGVWCRDENSELRTNKRSISLLVLRYPSLVGQGEMKSPRRARYFCRLDWLDGVPFAGFACVQ